MAGIDRRTGKPLSGWPHVAQSLDVLLTTFIGERTFRRRLGIDEDAILDKPMNSEEITDAFVAIASAIEPRMVNGHQYGEPRFDLVRVVPTQADASGTISFELQGLYYPMGHRGDFSVFETASLNLNNAVLT